MNAMNEFIFLKLHLSLPTALPCPSDCPLLPLPRRPTAAVPQLYGGDPPSLRMDSRPPNPLLLGLLTSLLHFSRCAGGESSYIIDAVGLTILPSSTVPSGTPVTIQCQVRVSHDGIPHPTHTFQLTQDDIAIHTSTTTGDKIVYELNPARAADSGSYECQVTVKDKSKTSFSQKLDVTGLQTPILYLNKTTLYEGDTFIATCSASDEKGSLIFRFFRRFRTEEPQKMKQVASNGNSTETKLVLRQVGDYFLYCDYEISLASGTRRSNQSNEVQVIVRGLHISPVMNVLPSPHVYEGDLMEVVCKVVNSLKNVDVFLTRDRRILKKAAVSLSHRFRAQEGDSGELVCKAEWGNLQKETYQVITVKELFSKPRLTVEPVDIFEGERFTLNCSVLVYVPERISNESMKFSIYKDSVMVTPSETYITVAHPSKNGNYTCKAQAASLAHSFVKESPTLVVKAKVLVSRPVLSVVGATLVLGKRFQLLCRSDDGTLPIIYSLHGPEGLIGRRAVSKPGEQAIFNSSAIFKSTQLNNFMCHAKNSQHKPPMVGSVLQLLHSTNIIEPVSKPVLTIVPNMGDISEGQDLTLTCSVQRGTTPISFTWYHTETEGPIAAKNSKKLEASHFIRNVEGQHKGGYYCVCTNAANETKQSHTAVIKVRLAGWKKGLIAVFCILLVLALVLVVAFKTRLLHFKRKRTGELSVKSASTKVERLSLTQAEVNEAANVTPGIMGKSVWSEHVSGSESDDQNSETATEPQYTEVKTGQADPNRAPVKKGTDTVYSEVRNSKQGVPEQTDGGSVEYAELNHDTDHRNDHGGQGDQADHNDHNDHNDQGDQGGDGNHGDDSVQHGEIDNSVDTHTADHGE
ncbi:putative platelet endothelial cell adhesion molecule-like isoform 3 [Scophthalmus maximus]|uniref:Putative platelet endothelial cell adhesion molecule-like isoform 3 n=1 Tax=Scophthalmus maximus TaxID=52904 RepID=A0A2U9CQ57_SCOMX|nr:putative platelet endothelial cell adhesion molecule-like isoform 3 [Scophthalmus maximus]